MLYEVIEWGLCTEKVTCPLGGDMCELDVYWSIILRHRNKNTMGMGKK